MTQAKSFRQVWSDLNENFSDNDFLRLDGEAGQQIVSYKFGSFYRRASRLALAFNQQLGLKRGDRVIVLSEYPIDIALVSHACWLGGQVVVLIDPNWDDQFITQTLENCNARCVLFTPTLAARTIAWSQQLKGVKDWIVGGGGGAVGLSTGGLGKLDSIIAAADPYGELPAKTDTKDPLALIVFTPGSEDLQHGVSFTESQLLAACDNLKPSIEKVFKDKSSSTCVTCYLPLKSINGLLQSFLMPLVSQIPVVLSLRNMEESLWDLVDRYSVRFVLLSQNDLRKVVLRTRSKASSLASEVTFLVVTREPLRAEVLHDAQKVFKAKVISSYSKTEAGGIVTILDPSSGPDILRTEGELQSSGAAINSVEIKIVGRDGEELEDGVEGQIMVRSNQLMSSYMVTTPGRCEPNNQGYLNTEDRGFITSSSDGNRTLVVLGRMRDRVETGTRIIDLNQIDRFLLSIRGVEMARTVILPSMEALKGEEIIEIGALVVPQRGVFLSRKEILTALEGRFSSGQYPTNIQIGDRSVKLEEGSRLSALKAFASR